MHVSAVIRIGCALHGIVFAGTLGNENSHKAIENNGTLMIDVNIRVGKTVHFEPQGFGLKITNTNFKQ